MATFVEIKSVLEAALNNLDDETFKSFKRILKDPSPTWHPMQRSFIEGEDREEIVDRVIRRNTIEKAPEIFLSVLEKIQERQAAQDLKYELQKVGYISPRTQDKGTQTSPAPVEICTVIEETPGKVDAPAPSLRDSENSQEATPTHRREKRGGPGAQSQRETGPKTSKRSLRNKFIKIKPGQGEGTGPPPPKRRRAPRNNSQNLQLDNLKQSLLTEFYPKMNSVSEVRPGLGAQSESPNPQTAAHLSGEGTRVQNVLRDERNTRRAPCGSHAHCLRSNASAPALQDRTNLQNATPAPPPRKRKQTGVGGEILCAQEGPSRAKQTKHDSIQRDDEETLSPPAKNKLK